MRHRKRKTVWAYALSAETWSRPLVWNRGDTRIAYVVKVVRYVGKAWSGGYARRRPMSFKGAVRPEAYFG